MRTIIQWIQKALERKLAFDDAEAIGQLERSSTSFWSVNELLEDVSTSDLSFFVLPYLYASALSQHRESLVVAIAEAGRFLETMRSLYVIPQSDPPPSPELFRQAKIQRAQRSRHLYPSVQQLVDTYHPIHKRDWVDDEEARSLWLATLEFFSLKALDDIRVWQQESQMTSKTTDSSSIPAPSMKVFKVDQRRECHCRVFQCGHSKPTLTVEEFYVQRYGNQPPISRPKETHGVSDDSEDELRRLRRQDAIRDRHARGSGNRYRRL